MPVILKNNASSTLATGITASDTGIVVADGSQFPSLAAGEYFYATLVSPAGTTEIVKVTARVSNSMTVVRAQDGSSAASFQVGARVDMRVNAATVNDLVDEHDEAAEISIVDTGGYYTGTNVEAALQEAAQASTTRIADAGGYYTGANVEAALVELAQDTLSRANVAALLADTLLTYSSVTAGDIIRTRTEGFSYEVAASGATDHHVTTAGGVKLYIPLVNPIYAKQWGVVADGLTDNSSVLIAMRNALVADDKHKHRHIILPEGIVQYDNNRWTENILRLTLEGYGTTIRCINGNASVGDAFVLGPREQMFRQNGDFLIGTWGLNVDLGYRFNGASVGGTSITLTNAGDGANFSAGDRIFLHGGATGVGGYTPNTNSWEWNTVASVLGGVLTLGKPIENKFNTDWPDFFYIAADTVNGVSIPEQRLGLPRVVLLDNKPQSDGTTYSYRKYLHFKGIKFGENPVSSSSDRLPTAAEILKFTDCFSDGVETDTRESQIVTLKNCVHTQGIELDKLVKTIEVEGCDFGFFSSNSASVTGGTTCKNITFRNCVFSGSFIAYPLENLIIENCEGSARGRADSSQNGAFMPGFAGKGNGKCYMRGLVGNHLPNQRILAGNLVNQANYAIGTQVDSSDGTCTEVFDQNNSPTTFDSFTPGKLIWLTSEPRVVGVLDDVFLDGTNIKWRFKSGNMGPSIKSGHITSPLNYSLIGFEILEIEGVDYADRSRFYDVNTGLIDWSKFQSDSVGYDINGTELAGDGTGSIANSGTRFEDILPNVNGTYRLTYDIATTSGTIVIRDGVSATNIVTLNGTGTAQTVDFSPIAGKSVQFRPNAFNGTFTPIRLDRL